MMKQDFLVIEISHICPTRPEQNDRSSQKQHALKGQKLLAQGNALGIKAFSKAPCKVGCSKSINFSTRFLRRNTS